MTAALLLVLKTCVVGMLCGIGLGSTPADPTYLLRRPALLFRSLFAMYVAIPLAALTIVQTVPLPAGVRMAILVLAISAGAPLLPRKLMALGREGYVFSLVVLSSLLAVVAVPAWLVVLGPYFVSGNPRWGRVRWASWSRRPLSRPSSWGCSSGRCLPAALTVPPSGC